jgi:hypothetical protein
MDGKVATMEDIARLLNETLDELDAQDAILGGGALNDDSSMLSSALDDSALGVAFGGSTLNSAHDRSTPGFALDGSSPSPTLNGPGGSMLGFDARLGARRLGARRLEAQLGARWPRQLRTWRCVRQLDAQLGARQIDAWLRAR